jgi:BCD family chlorophyll transporter-like MFS transporter
MAGGQAGRLLAVVVLGTLAFNMQDVLLEPYGGEVLGLSVARTTLLTAVYALGALAGFLWAARMLGHGRDPFRTAAKGILMGLIAFPAIIFAGPLGSTALFFAGAGLVGFGAGLFAVSTLTAAMTLRTSGNGAGLALGAWGAAQATAAGLSIFLGGALRDLVGHLAERGALGPALTDPTLGYSFVYHAEIGLLFLTLVALGPLVRVAPLSATPTSGDRFGIAEFPT